MNGLDVLNNAAIGYGGTYAAGTGGLIVSGNVGIGTWNPASAFVVIGGNTGIGYATPVYHLDVRKSLTTAALDVQNSQGLPKAQLFVLEIIMVLVN